MKIPPWVISGLSAEQVLLFREITKRSCVLASAGSGKTRALVHLIAADLVSGTPPTSIVAFTFTEKAADELLARVHLLMGSEAPEVPLTGMFIGTIHSWCFDYLRSMPEYYNFATLDELHLDSLVSRLYDSLELAAAYSLAYPRAVPNFLADLEIVYNEHLTLDKLPERVSPSIHRFLELLSSNRLLTFGGMVRSATAQLEHLGPVQGLRSLYVDEYQDVNPSQVALIKAMISNECKLVTVGDELQCIYQWRGSDVRRIVDFGKDFEHGSTHRLPTNFRSRPGIVRTGEAIAEQVTLRDRSKRMVPSRPETPSNPVLFLPVASEEEQTQMVVETAVRLHRDGVPWSRMAILLRSVMSWGRPIMDALIRAGVPVYCPLLSRGGEFLNDLILPVLDWLRTEHPEPRNESEEQKVEEASQKLWERVRPWIRADKPETTFWASLHAWNEQVHEQHNDAYDVRGRLYDFLNACAVRIHPNDNELMVGLGIGSQVIRSVEEIQRRRLRGQDRRTARGVMSEIYFGLIRYIDEFGESATINLSEDAVVITTVHQSKGLEWPVVVLPMLIDRRFPVARRPHGTSFPDEIASRYGTSTEDEWRLFYVACTRARERLFLISPSHVNGTVRGSTFTDTLLRQGAVDSASISNLSPATWAISSDDLAPAAPPPLRIGLSDLLIYLECPYQFGLRRVVDVQPSVGEELGFGMGLHELIQRRLDGGKAWTPKELERQVKQHVHLPYMSERSEQKSRAVIAKRILDLESLGLFDSKSRSEVPVESLMDGAIVHGIVDGIVENSDGSLTVRDWKSSIHKEYRKRYERQLQFYAHALRQQGATVSGADLVDVSASAEQRTLVRHVVDVSEGSVRALIEEMGRAVKGIQRRDFHATPSTDACGPCDMYRICSERNDDVTTLERQ